MNHITDINKTKLVSAAVVVLVAVFIGWVLFCQKPVGEGALTDMATTTTPAAPTVKKSGSTSVTSNTSRASQTVATIVANLSGTSQFNALLKSTGLTASMKSTGKYTIFVPTNAAFSQLPGGTISGMTAAQKLRLVQYHIVSGRAVDVDAEIAGTVDAISGDALNFNYTAGKVPMVNSALVISEYIGKNGVVYLIDNVLLPPKKAQGAL